MRTRIFWGGFALLAFILLIPLSISFYEKWEIYCRGRIVEVTVTSLPNRLAKSGNMKFEFNGKIYSESMNGSSSNYFQVGEKIQMRYLDGHRIFLFLEDNPIGWGIFVLLMIFSFGVYFVYCAFKKDSPSVQAFGRKLS